MLNAKMRSVDVHQFAMIPRAEIPRSTFRMPRTYKTTFDTGYLVPVMCEEVLPGDTWKVAMTSFCRLATPIVPVMDNLHLASFFFFVPCRLVWSNWVRFQGEQDNPADSISYVVPQLVSPVGGFAVSSVFDYFGLPTVGQVGGGSTVSVNALPLRAYNLIYNQWFRDENLSNAAPVAVDNGPDALGSYGLWRRGKRHDYFTSCLPWPQKGNTAVTLPLGTTATVKTAGSDLFTGAQNAMRFLTNVTGAAPGGQKSLAMGAPANTMLMGESATALTAPGPFMYPSNLYADLSTATAATINSIRLAFQTQRLLERDARGGTRYTEILRSHFGVVSPDFRLQRAEYLGGGDSPITFTPIAQTAQTGLTGGSTPLGTLGAAATAVASGHGFHQSFTEHGYIIGLVSVRADLTYQQGLRRLWKRSTRYDFYMPVFAMLGEQAVLNSEIYCDGSANDALGFGYQERWGELRYSPSMITGLFRSTSAGTLDIWHLAQKFTALPVLGSTFILDTPPVSRVLAVTSTGKEMLFDSVFEQIVTRPLPMYSVPGLMDHF